MIGWRVRASQTTVGDPIFSQLHSVPRIEYLDLTCIITIMCLDFFSRLRLHAVLPISDLVLFSDDRSLAILYGLEIEPS